MTMARTPDRSPAPGTRAVPQRQEIYTAPPESGKAVLGRTLPSLLDEACERWPNEKALNERAEDGWRSLSTENFKREAQEAALGLLELGMARGDRVLFFTHSDLSFCLPDMACLTAGLVSVPLYLTHSEGAIRHILGEAEAKALVVSDEKLFEEIEPLLDAARGLETVILMRPTGEVAAKTDLELNLITWEGVRERGRAAHDDVAEAAAHLKTRLSPADLATLIYTSGTTGRPKGVMLSHENISYNALTAFSGLPDIKPGEEVALSFLPLTHVFARALHYGYLQRGVAVYFGTPDSIREDFKEVKPTLFASVPRVLEKAYERILAAGEALTGVKRGLFDWALELAKAYDVTREPAGRYAWQLRLADRLVLSKWREALGGRVRYVIVGGAALRGDLVNVFGAAKVSVLQGYGLTETSPVIAYNRPGHNRPGTVGVPLPGLEVSLSKEGEIVTRGPHIMGGYYKNPDATARAVDKEGWFHTGDLGSFTDDGFLTITGRAKSTFKLSTGKFVIPQPLEAKLEADPLIEHALVVGDGEKHCAALLFVNKEALRNAGRRWGDEGAGLESGEARAHFRDLIKAANAEMPHWSQVKKVALIEGDLTIDNGLLTPTLKVRRPKVLKEYKAYLEGIYRGTSETPDVVLEID